MAGTGDWEKIEEGDPGDEEEENPKGIPSHRRKRTNGRIVHTRSLWWRVGCANAFGSRVVICYGRVAQIAMFIVEATRLPIV